MEDSSLFNALSEGNALEGRINSTIGSMLKFETDRDFRETPLRLANTEAFSEPNSRLYFEYEGLIEKLDQVAEDLDRALMVAEDFRAFECRRNYCQGVFNRSRRQGRDSLRISCSLSELYGAFNDFSRVISFVEHDGAGTFIVSLGDFDLKLKVKKSDLELECKEKVVSENRVFSQEDSAGEDNECAENCEFSEFLVSLRENMKVSHSELQELALHYEPAPIEFLDTNFGPEYSQLKKRENALVEQLEWQSAELSSLKKYYQEEADDITRMKSRVELYCSTVKRRDLFLVKTEEKLEKNSRNLQNALRELRESQEEHQETLETLQSRMKSFLRNLETRFGPGNYLKRHRLQSYGPDDFQLAQGRLDSLGPAASGFPLQRSRLQTHLSTIKSFNVLSKSFNQGLRARTNATPNGLRTQTHSALSTTDLDDSFHCETVPNPQLEDKALLREVTIIKARLAEKEEDLMRKREDLYCEWVRLSEVDDVLPAIYAYNEKLDQREKELEEVQEDLDRQKLALASRTTALNRKEQQEQTTQNIFNEKLWGFHSDLTKFLDGYF